MASYKPGDSYTRYFTTCDPATGAAKDADATPTVTVFHSGTGSGAFALVATKVGTGVYSVAGAIPGTFVSGDVVNLVVNATVGGIAGKAPLDSFVIDGKRVSDLAFPTNFAALQITSEGLAGLNTAQSGIAVRALDSVADSALTIGDCLIAAVSEGAGKESISGTTYQKKTPSTGTVIRTFTLDDAAAPTSRS